MISILNKFSFLLLFGLIFGLCFVVPTVVFASQTLTISPTLFNAKVAPGQSWSSAIKVINGNDYPITVYPGVTDFAVNNETGRPELVPLDVSVNQGDITLSSWVSLEQTEVLIPARQSVSVPFTMTVPFDAPPGGHYAAILISTRPGEATPNTSQVSTAQILTSLLFLKVDGNIIEQASIREFSTKRIVQKPETTFTVRIQNEGNVHIQPQGEIKIFNMWGAERGIIPINQQTQYGLVVKESIRKFEFTWESTTSLFDLGRYQAVLTLGYGDEGRKFINQTTNFWVIPYTTIGIVFGGFLAIVWLVSLFIRLYIRRMLALSGINPDEMRQQRSRHAFVGDVVINRPAPVSKNYLAPTKTFLFDLGTLWRERTAVRARTMEFLSLYRYVFLGIVILIILVICMLFLINIFTKEQTNYNVTITTESEQTTLSAEMIAYEALPVYEVPEALVWPEQLATVELINTSGEVGVAARLHRILDGHGIIIESLSYDDTRMQPRTAIVYDAESIEVAVALSKFLNNAPLSLRTDNQTSHITVFVGEDLKTFSW
jgi:hypothetical protein